MDIMDDEKSGRKEFKCQKLSVMAEKSDEELIKIITVDKIDYNPMAVKTARQEIRKRNIPIARIRAIEKKSRPKREQKDYRNFQKRNLADFEKRLISFIVDAFISCGAGFFITLALAKIFPSSKLDHTLWPFFIVSLILLLIYCAAMEFKYQQTVGKMLTETKVYTTEGAKPTQYQIILRTFARLFFPVSFLFHLALSNFYKSFRPPLVHDFLSSTRVRKITKNTDADHRYIEKEKRLYKIKTKYLYQNVVLNKNINDKLILGSNGIVWEILDEHNMLVEFYEPGASNEPGFEEVNMYEINIKDLDLKEIP